MSSFNKFHSIVRIKGVPVHHTEIVIIKRFVSSQSRHLVNRRIGIFGIYFHNHPEILPFITQISPHISFYHTGICPIDIYPDKINVRTTVHTFLLISIYPTRSLPTHTIQPSPNHIFRLFYCGPYIRIIINYLSSRSHIVSMRACFVS